MCSSDLVVKTAVRTGPGTSPAATFFEPALVGGGYTLARVSPHTGRKHQIRAHALWLGHPVIGDKLYGGDGRLRMARDLERVGLAVVDRAVPLDPAVPAGRHDLPRCMPRQNSVDAISGVSSVTFGGVAALFTVLSTSSIVTSVPTGGKTEIGRAHV